MTILFSLLLGAATAGLLVFQLLHLDGASLWHDESFSALLIQMEWGEMFWRIGLDVHPPLYYALLKLWAAVTGTSLFALRLFSLLFGVLAAAGTYLLAKEIFKRSWLAAVSAVLLFAAAFQGVYHVEARMYTLGEFFIVFSSLFLLKGLKAPSARAGLPWWLAYAVFVAAALYTHYFTVFAILAQGLFAAWWTWRNKQNLRMLLGAAVLAGISYVPWLPTFWQQFLQVQENFWIPQVTVWSVPNTVLKMLTGVQADPQQLAWLLVLVPAVVLGAIALVLFKDRSPARWLPAAGFLLPFPLALLLSLRTSIFLDRYFVFFLPFLAILLASAAWQLPPLARRAAAGLLVVGALVSFPLLWNDLNVPQNPGMASAADFINQEATPGDRIYAGSSFVFFVFQYYNETGLEPKLFAPNELAHFSGTALLEGRNDTIASFPERVPGAVFKLDTTAFGNLQPEVPESWQLLEERSFGEVRPYGHEIIVRKYAAP